MAENQKLIAKVTDRGVVWTTYYIRYKTLAYKMERAGSTKRQYAMIDEIEVRPASDGSGWEVVLYGDPVATGIRYKRDAQRQAEELLDNNKDSYGFFLKTTGIA